MIDIQLTDFERLMDRHWSNLNTLYSTRLYREMFEKYRINISSNFPRVDVAQEVCQATQNCVSQLKHEHEELKQVIDVQRRYVLRDPSPIEKNFLEFSRKKLEENDRTMRCLSRRVKVLQEHISNLVGSQNYSPNYLRFQNNIRYN